MKTKRLVLCALLAALLFVAQIAFSWLPNIELVSLLLILYTLTLQCEVLLILYTFVLLEGLVYGFGMWWISYLYVWTVLCGAVALLRRHGRPGVFSLALVSGCFGMAFGLLCAFPYLIVSGPGAAYSWWVAGIPFDILHGVSNFLFTLVLAGPLCRLLTTLNKNF